VRTVTRNAPTAPRSGAARSSTTSSGIEAALTERWQSPLRCRWR
jgi:hypothetical protein